MHIKPNKIETTIDRVLQNNFPNEWEYNGDFSQGITIGRMIPDFVNVNGKKEIIEVFGNYWHEGDRVKNRWKRTEFGIKAAYSQLGFDCVVLWTSELNKLHDNEIAQLITERLK